MKENSISGSGRWPRTRWQAGGFHLLLSSVMGFALFALIRWVWYPGVLFGLSGGLQLAVMIIVIDVVIGPLLTTLVFSRTKKHLWFDLTVIALLQLTAFAYGFYITFAARPVFLVAAIDRVQVVAASEIPPENWQGVDPDKRPGLMGPRWVGVTVPFDQRLREGILFGEVGGGVDMPYQPVLYQPYDSVKQELAAHAKSSESMQPAKKIAACSAAKLDCAQSFQFVPLVARRGAGIMLIDESGRPGALVAVDPWTAD